MMEFCASISSSPLFSSIVTLCTLILLYFPYHFLTIVFSPVLIITGIILITILRLGAIQRFETEADEPKEKEQNNSPLPQTEYSVTNESREDQDHSFFGYQSETETEMGFYPNPCFEDFFFEWNLKAPLEVIYEEYEGEEEEEEEEEVESNQKQENQVVGFERQASLSRYYPESDSDGSSDGGAGAWDSPETMCFRWEEEDREGLIEIALDGRNTKRGLDFHHEEENLIEIDISPTRNNEFCRENWQFSG